MNASEQLEPRRPDRGGWSRENAAHLLRRCGFGASAEEIEQALQAGQDQTIKRLLSAAPEPWAAPPAEAGAADSTLRDAAWATENIGDLKAWWLHRMLRSPHPLLERMTLFWHNHFATSNAKVRSAVFMARQNDLLRRHALGSIRDLLKGMARDPAMLVWLDGNANRRRHPNENFARELMELFSLGEGHYSEQDIKEAARAFTGWQVRGDQFWFNAAQHDAGSKTVLGRSGNLDGDDVIEICLAQPACPRFLAGKLLSSFVTPRPDAATIDALAQRIREHDYQIRPVMGELLRSKLFFDPTVRGAIVKSPLDYVLGSFRVLGGQPNLPAVSRLLAELGQDVFEPPTVKGWEGGRQWINSATLVLRANFAAELTGSERFGAIDEPSALCQAHGLDSSEQQVRFYVDLLLGGTPDAEVLVALDRYALAAAGRPQERVRGLLHLFLSLPEYQVM